MMRRRQRRARYAPVPSQAADEQEAKKPGDLGSTRGGRALRRVLVGIAVLVSLGVAGIGGWRSFTAVSTYFHSWTVPAIADGVIIAASALRLAALTYHWRMPGSMLVTCLGLGGTVYLNVHAAPGNGAEEFSHALAPVAYLILLEMLGYFLKLRLQLEVQEEARLTLLVWLVSPVVTTRAWLLMVRTGEKNPANARAAIQRSIRARSQLQIICPAPWFAPLGAARGARSAALQTIRDGLLQPHEVIGLLPEGRARMDAVELLVAVNRAALLPAGDVPAELVDDDQADAGPDDDEIPVLVKRMEQALAVREARPPFHEVAIELGCSSEVFWTVVEAMGGWEQTWDRLHPSNGQAELVSLPAPRSEQVPALAAAPQYREAVQAPAFGQDAAVPSAPRTAVVTRTLGGNGASNAKARYFERADELTGNGTNALHDLLSLDSKLRIAAAVAVFDELGLSVTLPTVRKYSQAYLEEKLGRPLNAAEEDSADGSDD